MSSCCRTTVRPRVERTTDNLRLGADMVVLRDFDVLDDKVPLRMCSHPVPKRSALFPLLCGRLLLEPRQRDMILMFSRAGHMYDLYGVIPGLHYIYNIIYIYIYIYLLFIITITIVIIIIVYYY